MTHTTAMRRVYALIIFLILIVCYGYFTPRWGDWNANSRADLVYAVGDLGVLHIDDYHENTGDKACYPGPYDIEADTCQGHYYTDKSLGPSLVALPFYMVFKGIAQIPPVQRFIHSDNLPGNFASTLDPEGRGITAESVYQGLALTFMTFFAMSLPSALLGTVVFLFAARFTDRLFNAAILALAFGLATIAFPYSNTLTQHQLAAFGTFVGWYLLWRVIYENASQRWLWIVGLLFGLVAITEYPTVVIAGPIFLWAVYVYPRRIALYRVIVGAIPVGLIFAAYNLTIFGTPLPVGYEYSTLWQDVHTAGFLSFTAPTLERYYGLLFSPVKGLFLLSPFLLLVVPGLILMWKRLPARRSAAVMLALIILGYITLYASSAMWWGGYTVGPRYLVPLIPFMALPIIFAFDYLLTRGWGTILTSLLLLLSTVHVWGLTIAGQHWPSTDLLPLTFETMNASFPIVDYALPLLAQGNIARNYGELILNLNGFAGLIPLLLAVLVIGAGLPFLLRRTYRHKTDKILAESPAEVALQKLQN